MGHYITSVDFATASAAIRSSENAAFPASNVLLTQRPGRLWKGSALNTSTWVGLDLGSATACVAMLVDNINVASVVIEADDDPAFGSIDYTSGATAVSQDLRDGRYKLCLIFASQTNRYWRVRSNTTTSTDGDTVMSCGGVTLMTATNEWDHNPMLSCETARRTRNDQNNSVAFALGPRYAELTLTQSPVIRSELHDQLIAYLGERGEHQPLVFFENNSNTSQAYLCRRVGAFRADHAGPGHYTMNAVTLREYE